MNPNQLSPDDPRLTLYALGEMEPQEQARFEQLLEQDPAARQLVDEIRAMASTVTAALEQEPAEVAPAKAAGKVLRFPQAYFMISGLAAACFAVFFVLWQNEQDLRKQTHFVEVPLTPVAAKQSKDDKAVAESSVTVALPPAAVTGTETVSVVAIDLAQPSPIQIAPPMQDSIRGGSNTQRAEVSSMPADAIAREDRALAEMSAASAARKNEAERVAAAAKLQKRQLAGDTGLGAIAATSVPSPAAAPKETTLFNMAASGGSGAPAAPALDPNSVAFAESPAPPLGKSANDETIKLESFMVSASPASARAPKGKLNLGAPSRESTAFGYISGGRDRDANTEAYAQTNDNGFLRVGDQPLSTFSIDVDTASYANVRRFLKQNRRPPASAVRIEELVNYFPYDYAAPTGNVPFAASLEVASAPWMPDHRLVRIGLKGREVSDAQRPPANLVFLLDVSGSMTHPNKLPLVKQSLRLLVEKLRPDDRVAIAVYAGASGLALPSTSAREKATILEAINELTPGGSTNGAMGIQLAYDIAKANFVPGGVNRVILATDGDFNVGTTSEGELVNLIEEKAKSGVFLSVLGYGMGNLKDSTLEQLADKGNGNYAYIDSLAEAKKTLVEQAGGTLMTIAKDVKIQVEFNPAQVQAYRLIGYENRMLAKEDFNNDKIDAGEIGAGHTVTALYEVVPVGAAMPDETPAVDGLKYQKPKQGAGSLKQGALNAEMLTVKIRYKEPAGEVSSKLEFPLVDGGTAFADASPDFKFAASVAGFGMALRDSPHKGQLTLADVLVWGQSSLGQDPGGYRAEFLTLVGVAERLVR
jgi:Ca-activated chloride channel family protein